MNKKELETELSFLKLRRNIKLLLIDKGLSGEEERKQKLKQLENQISQLEYASRTKNNPR